MFFRTDFESAARHKSSAQAARKFEACAHCIRSSSSSSPRSRSDYLRIPSTILATHTASAKSTILLSSANPTRHARQFPAWIRFSRLKTAPHFQRHIPTYTRIVANQQSRPPRTRSQSIPPFGPSAFNLAARPPPQQAISRRRPLRREMAFIAAPARGTNPPAITKTKRHFAHRMPIGALHNPRLPRIAPASARPNSNPRNTPCPRPEL